MFNGELFGVQYSVQGAAALAGVARDLCPKTEQNNVRMRETVKAYLVYLRPTVIG